MTVFAFEWTPREKWIATIAGGLLIILGILFWAGQEEDIRSSQMQPYASTKQTTKSVPTEGSLSKENEKGAEHQVVIDVKGAVQRPGIYTMTAPVRIYQVIQQAGGVIPDGDTSSLNLAEQAVDGTVLYVPRKGETPPDMAGSQNSSNKNSQKININTATAEELDKLNGLGPSKANAIVEYRKEHGKFRTMEDLTQVPGIGEKTIEQFRDQVEVK